ncbi:ABC transporter ATP-binding protein [Roseomonas terrae]|uniref:ABC transporter ATP-binding protein n=1 Tax=Neoroseomonas terrae TaxID=424799 RepID=A0ABS5EFM5_9PROT|nr:ABC transporter ATP-binding protein [Neoroseomonas terrae]MBR0649829.1 ABC transporter ATP-binding protein [Neoroseomonas terrae]
MPALLRLVAPVRWRLAIACLLAIVGTICAVAPLLLLAAMIAAAAAGQGDHVPALAIAAFVALLLQGPALGASTGIAHHAAFDLLFDLRRRLMRHLATLPLGYFTTRQTTTIKRVLNEEVEAVELFASHQLPDVVSSVATILALAGVMFWADWRMALAVLAVIPLASLAQMLMMRGHGTKIGSYFGRISKVNAAAVEMVQGLETLRTARGAALIRDGMQRQIRELYEFSEAWRREWMPPWIFYSVIIGAAPLFALPLGLWLHAAGLIDIPTFIFCLLAATGFGQPLLKLALYTEILLRVQQAERKITALLDAPATTAPAGPAALQAGDIVFEGVALDQGGCRLLDGIDLTIPAGAITAIVGPSGAGKTSLVRLLDRSLDPSAGRITIGGEDIAGAGPEAVSRLVGVMTQTIFLFDDTVRENIRLARAGATDAEVEQAARAAHCDAFVRDLPQGYDTRVGEGGTRLSGGQRQRIALARTLLAGLPILVLDEATSFIDPLHEASLQDAVGRLVGPRTVVIVSHRLDSVTQCDRIVLVEGGRVLGAGTHEELLATLPRYAALWRIQQANLAWEVTPAMPVGAEP